MLKFFRKNKKLNFVMIVNKTIIRFFRLSRTHVWADYIFCCFLFQNVYFKMFISKSLFQNHYFTNIVGNQTNRKIFRKQRYHCQKYAEGKVPVWWLYWTSFLQAYTINFWKTQFGSKRCYQKNGNYNKIFIQTWYSTDGNNFNYISTLGSCWNTEVPRQRGWCVLPNNKESSWGNQENTRNTLGVVQIHYSKDTVAFRF